MHEAESRGSLHKRKFGKLIHIGVYHCRLSVKMIVS
jgi:hypothetical protein